MVNKPSVSAIARASFDSSNDPPVTYTTNLIRITELQHNQTKLNTTINPMVLKSLRIHN